MRFCIILGAMKAGTTSLFNYLAQHPQIAPSKKKEPSFFSHYYDKGLEYYLSLWKKEDVETKWLLEASVNYTKYPAFKESSHNLLDFTQKNNVNLKFIYIMRDPIERLESQYTYSYARWITDTLEDRIKHGHIVDVSQFARQLDQYYEKFNPDQFLLLDFDDLKRKPEEVLKRTCEFLNVDTDFTFSSLDEVYNKSEGKVITRPIDRLFLKHPRLKAFSKLFPKRLKQSIARLIFQTKIAGNFKVTDAQRGYVFEALKDDMARLHDKYGIDVSKWGF